MPKYNVILNTQKAYDYAVEADNMDEAIEMAKHINESQTPAEELKHLYDFNWLECEAYRDREAEQHAALCKR